MKMIELWGINVGLSKDTSYLRCKRSFIDTLRISHFGITCASTRRRDSDLILLYIYWLWATELMQTGILDLLRRARYLPFRRWVPQSLVISEVVSLYLVINCVYMGPLIYWILVRTFWRSPPPKWHARYAEYRQTGLINITLKMRVIYTWNHQPATFSITSRAVS